MRCESIGALRSLINNGSIWGCVQHSTQLLAIIVLVLAVGMFAQWLARITKTPSIVYLLGAGIILGPEVLGVIDPLGFGVALRALVALSVAIIVFEGGVGIDVGRVRPVGKTVLSLASIGVAITLAGACIAAGLFVGMSWITALLFGAIVTATGPTVITPIVRQIKVNDRVGTILVTEGVLNDAVSVVLAAVFFELMLTTDASFGYGLSALLTRVGIGALIGAVFGLTIVFVLESFLMEENHARLFTITVVLIAFTASEVLAGESGILAVAISAFIVGLSDVPYKASIKQFKEDVSIILLSIIFILLAALIRFNDIIAMGVGGIAVVLVLMLVVRPLAVFISTLGSKLKTREKVFIAAMAPRGVVPASMATYFAMQMGGSPEVAPLVGMVFITIIVTVLVTGTLSGYLAKKLEVIPMDVLVIGGGGVGRTLAKRLDTRGENVTIIDTREENCRKTMELGIKAIQGDGGDVEVLKKAGITRAKALIATTDQDNTNLLVCQVAKTNFGFNENQLVARVNNPENFQAFTSLGIKSMSPVVSSAVILENLLERPAVFSICEVGEGGDIREVPLLNNDFIGRNVKEINENLPSESIIVLVRRNGETIIPRDEVALMEGDHVSIIGKLEDVRAAANLLSAG